MAKACSELCGMNVELDSQALSLHLPGREQHMPLVPPEDSLYQQEIDYLQRTGGKTITEGIDFLKGNLRNSSISMTLKEIIDFRKLANEQFQGNSHENTLGIINTLFHNPSDDYFERFLCDKARSGELDMTGSNYHVAFAKVCLRSLKMGSKSYIMPPQLPSSIPPELCYASKFWLRHAIEGLPTKPKELDAVIIELLESCDISWVYILNTLQCTNIAVEGIKQLTSYYACASENIKDSFMDKLEHYKMRMNQFLTIFGDNEFQSSGNIISTNFTKSAPPTQWTCTTHYTYSNQIPASYTEQNDCPYLISLPLEGSSEKHLQRLCIEVKCHDQGKRFTSASKEDGTWTWIELAILRENNEGKQTEVDLQEAFGEQSSGFMVENTRYKIIHLPLSNSVPHIYCINLHWPDLFVKVGVFLLTTMTQLLSNIFSLRKHEGVM
ncbi:hypothetical protein F5879DRAFT_920833 [Lentinula edodes]|nr:hypothetical protein F5879DRAFT_920833 [Lentinula edodes]